jgi:hypothetical protein
VTASSFFLFAQRTEPDLNLICPDTPHYAAGVFYFGKEMQENAPDNQIVIYRNKDGTAQLEVNLREDTVWLNQKQMAALFDKDVRTINEHTQNIFQEGELEESSVIRKFRITAADGKQYRSRRSSA